jgi:hypothetical protein
MKRKGFTGNSPFRMNPFAVDEQSSKHEQIILTFEGGGAICRSGGLQGVNSPIHLCLLAIFRFFFSSPYLSRKLYLPFSSHDDSFLDELLSSPRPLP